MSRLQGYCGGFQVDIYYGKEADFRTKVIAVRDRIRAAFDLASGQTTRVGDVFKWQAENVNKVGYAFQIRHYNAGNPTGHEWTLIFPWYGDSAYYVGGIIGQYNGTRLANHFRRYDNSVGTFDVAKCMVRYFDKLDLTARYTASATTGSVAVSDTVQLQGDPTITGVIESVASGTDIRIRQTAGRKFRNTDIIEVVTGGAPGSTFTVDTETEARFSDVGYTNHATMSLAADGDAISGFNPYTNEDDFFPDRTTEVSFKGAILNFSTDAAVNEHVELAYDDVIPAMTVIKTARRSRAISSAFVSGAILEPYDVADTEENGCALFSMNNDSGNCGQISQTWINGRYHTFSGGGGLAENFALSYSNILTTLNEKNGSGEFLKQKMIVQNSNEFKGWIREDIAHVIGAYQQRLYQQFNTAAGTFLKVNWDFAILYHNQVGITFIRWDQENDFPVT